MTKLQSFGGRTVLAAAVVAALVVMRAEAVAPQPGTATLLTSGLMGASGSTVGPGHALYVTEGALGRISRIDTETGVVTPFATGLPIAIVGIGGAIDVAFIGQTAYVLVTLVGNDVGGSSVVGLYRIDGPGAAPILVADIGTFATLNPPPTQFDVPTGLQFALDRYQNGFLVTDGHHNRVLRVERNGRISVFRQFGNIVPTGLAVVGAQVFMAEAGPVPHLPQDGRIVLMHPPFAGSMEVAAGAPLLVDVEFGRGKSLYALSQGVFPEDGVPAAPALPNTGALLRVGSDGTMTPIVSALNLPTSMEFIQDQAFVVTLGGEVWKITLP